MKLHGSNFIAGALSRQGSSTFFGINAVTGEKLDPIFAEATVEEIHEVLSMAACAFEGYRTRSPEQIAAFLEAIAAEILKLDAVLIQRAAQETALPEQRLLGERARTVGQIKMFADLVREGSWVEATIDRAIPDRKPLPKPDLRRMLIPIGPVVVFGASNFPLAFSVAGGDTISALAAGNPVVVKAHPAHPGTSELVAAAIIAAVEATGMPSGTFSMVHGAGHEAGLALVRHPATKAVGFTGSLKAGRALFDAAAARPEPIPVFAEMGSTNPVFILPGALAQNAAAIAEGLVQSVTMGVGQFCTNPGVVFGLKDAALVGFSEKVAELVGNAPAGTMLHDGICRKFHEALNTAATVPGVRVVKSAADCSQPNRAPAAILATDAATFRQHAVLREEIFGPSTIVVSCDSELEMEAVAREMAGQLTATIHGTPEDLTRNAKLVSILQQKVGRLLFNGFPTGVEVCPSMHHGGPYPATTDARTTSVGTAAIKRFARPICFQNFPDAALPVDLRNQNLRKIWRLIDNQLTRDNC